MAKGDTDKITRILNHIQTQLEKFTRVPVVKELPEVASRWANGMFPFVYVHEGGEAPSANLQEYGTEITIDFPLYIQLFVSGGSEPGKELRALRTSVDNAINDDIQQGTNTESGNTVANAISTFLQGMTDPEYSVVDEMVVMATQQITYIVQYDYTIGDR